EEKKEARKEKRADRKEARKERRASRRGRRRFDGDYSMFSSVTPQFSNEDSDFAFNGIEF
ncbi:hypothetical protein EBZ38_16885, partial [bacterium]|nr:hypothetical protein [bacterium]